MSESTAPSKIFAKLRSIAPSILFQVKWEEDRYFRWDGDGPDPRERGYDPHDVDVSATAIVKGQEVQGEASLGGVYDKPDKKDPDIHGYLPQMLEEAASKLSDSLPGGSGRLIDEVQAACEYLKRVLKLRYQAQRKGR
jgi:hypothetical protein